MKYLPYILIILIIFLAAGFYIDRTSEQETNNLSLMTNDKAMGADLKNYGQAAEFTGINKWLNSEQLTMQGLRGKVVLIDFWTYSCINCIRTLPYVTGWYEKYKDDGLVIVGVHTPEFEFEKVASNVETAIKRYNINYPVAQDNNFATWNAYKNRFWPAHYLVDQKGQIVYTHFGEGSYDITENKIRFLLGLDDSGNESQSRTEARSASGTGIPDIRSPEMYFGTSRLENLTSGQSFSREPANYTLSADIKLNKFALEGPWQFQDEYTVSRGAGKIRLKFFAGKLHMVAASPGKTIKLKIIVNGQTQKEVEVGQSDLYTLFDSEDYSEHIIDIDIPEAGFEAYTFTFG